MPAYPPLYYTEYEGASFADFHAWDDWVLTEDVLSKLRDPAFVLMEDKRVHALFFRGSADTVFRWDCVSGQLCAQEGWTMTALIADVQAAQERKSPLLTAAIKNP